MKSKWYQRFKSIGGNSTINTRGGLISYPDGGTYVFKKDFDFFTCVTQNQQDYGLPSEVDEIHLYGVPCSDNYEHHTIVVLLEKKTGHMFGFPMFTETTLALSPVIREHRKEFEVKYATLLKKPQINYTRWIRIHRCHDGITGIFEMTGEYGEKQWNIMSYLWDKDAELLKVELQISPFADFVHTEGPNGEQ